MIIYGLGPDSDEELSPETTLVAKTRLWLRQRQRGYLPIQDRCAEAETSVPWEEVNACLLRHA
jgi:hypothetical protein